MKEYTKPVIEITALDNEDVITASGGVAIANFNKNGKSYSVVEF